MKNQCFKTVVFSLVFVVVMLLSNVGVKAQCPNNEFLTTGNPRIHSLLGSKSFTIGGNGTCADVSMQLRYDFETPYFGHLALTTPGNYLVYTQIKPIFSQRGDVVLQSETARDIILTTRRDDGFIRFATTPLSPGPDFERMTISPEGKVGIGVTPLFMNGNSYIIGTFDVNLRPENGNNNWGPKISFSKATESPNYPQIRLYQSCGYLFGNGKFQAYPWYIESSDVPSGPFGALSFKTVYGNSASEGKADAGDEANLINIMTLVRNGNVGIGYTNPGFKLNVDGNVGIGFPVPSAIDPTGQMLAVNGKVRIGTHEVPSGSQYFNTYKLSVDGTIICTELIVALPDCWADFVFKKDYKLPSLEEIEKSIKQNGTLPGIPSELDVKNKGVNVAEVQAKLLQKIEELTLYMIDMNKENKALKEKVEAMDNSIKQLKKSKKQ